MSKAPRASQLAGDRIAHAGITDSMFCFRFRKSLIRYSEGTLSEKRASATERHLLRCRGCREDLALIQQISSAVRNARVAATEPSPDLWSRVESELTTPARAPIGSRSGLRYAGAVGIAVLVVIAAVGIGRMGRFEAPPSYVTVQQSSDVSEKLEYESKPEKPGFTSEPSDSPRLASTEQTTNASKPSADKRKPVTVIGTQSDVAAMPEPVNAIYDNREQMSGGPLESPEVAAKFVTQNRVDADFKSLAVAPKPADTEPTEVLSAVTGSLVVGGKKASSPDSSEEPIKKHSLGLIGPTVGNSQQFGDSPQPVYGTVQDMVAVYNRGGMLHGCIAQYEAILKARPDDTEAMRFLLAAYEEIGNQRGRAHMASRLLEREPENAPLWYRELGSAAASQGNADLALECWRKGLEINPITDTAHILQEAASHGLLSDLESWYEHASATKNKATPLLILALTLEEQGYYERASAIRKDLSNLEPANQQFWVLLGDDLLNAGKHTEAREAFERVLTMDNPDLRAIAFDRLQQLQQLR